MSGRTIELRAPTLPLSSLAIASFRLSASSLPGGTQYSSRRVNPASYKRPSGVVGVVMGSSGISPRLEVVAKVERVDPELAADVPHGQAPRSISR